MLREGLLFRTLEQKLSFLSRTLLFRIEVGSVFISLFLDGRDIRLQKSIKIKCFGLGGVLIGNMNQGLLFAIVSPNTLSAD